VIINRNQRTFICAISSMRGVNMDQMPLKIQGASRSATCGEKGAVVSTVKIQGASRSATCGEKGAVW
jgi:hypothetical protein